MKKRVVPFLIGVALLTSTLSAQEEAFKPSLRQREEFKMEDEVKIKLQEIRKKLSELAHNDQTVMKNFDSFSALIQCAHEKEKRMTLQEVEQICRGVEFAAEKHRLQTRKNPEKTPYISHPIGVAYHLMSIGNVRDYEVILGALLHDVVEDTQTTYEEIENKFGQSVASYVREMTDDKSLAKEARKRLQVIKASHTSKGAAQIKLADKLYNLQDLFDHPPKEWTQTRIDRYYEWAQSVIDRLPKANDKLYEAVEEIINTYWEKQSPS
jgi:guanosine-3',5'-bis(diphosphate) 3'-pyrophosphohydrolase